MLLVVVMVKFLIADYKGMGKRPTTSRKDSEYLVHMKLYVYIMFCAMYFSILDVVLFMKVVDNVLLEVKPPNWKLDGADTKPLFGCRGWIATEKGHSIY